MVGAVTERRRSPRWPADAFRWTRVRLRPGRDAALVNLAKGGMLVEGARLYPGAPVVLQLIGPSSATLISGTVVRCQVAALERDAGVRYRGAISFDAAIDLEFSGGAGL